MEKWNILLSCQLNSTLLSISYYSTPGITLKKYSFTDRAKPNGQKPVPVMVSFVFVIEIVCTLNDPPSSVWERTISGLAWTRTK